MSDSEGQTSTDQAWNCDFPVESWTYILSKKMILKKKAYIGDCCPVLSVKISVTPAPTLQRGNWIQEYLCSGISPNWNKEKWKALCWANVDFPHKTFWEKKKIKRENMGVAMFRKPSLTVGWREFINLCRCSRF